MEQPILKMQWERFSAHVDLDINTAAKLLLPYSQSSIDSLNLLSDGCANTHYKVVFKDNTPPVVIRIYLREKSALLRELAIHQLVADQIPVPTYLYSDAECHHYPYPYAVIEWVEGVLMREIILQKDEKAIKASAFEAGEYLDRLRQIRFDTGGFFQEGLKIRPFSQEEKYLPYILNLLEDRVVKESLGNVLSDAVSKLVTQYSDLLPNEKEVNLTHADYDPANILVKECHGKWKIVSILDWEFAFAGTYLLDIGMMLRYSHRLPAYYEQQFIAGIEANGFSLLKDWKRQAKLMDLICLLQLVHYNPFTERPKLNRDVISLIGDTVRNWGSI